MPNTGDRKSQCTVAIGVTNLGVTKLKKLRQLITANRSFRTEHQKLARPKCIEQATMRIQESKRDVE